MSPSYATMSGEMSRFLREVWMAHRTINGWEDIYKRYKGTSSAAAAFDQTRQSGDLKVFLEGLRSVAGGKEIWIQGYPRGVFDDIAQLVVGGLGNSAGILDMLKQHFGAAVSYEEMLDDLWFAFYHVLRPGFSTAGVRKRVYIHAAAPLESSTVRIMRVLSAKLGTIPGFQEAKTCGPGGTAQLDSIVAYCDDDRAVNQVLDALRGANLNCMAPGLPRLVAPANGLAGVGVADEPPDIQIGGKFDRNAFRKGIMNPEQHSFGTFLGKLVWMALEPVKHTHSEPEFIDNVLTLFQICRINPRHPHLHPAATDLAMLQRTWAFSRARRRT